MATTLVAVFGDKIVDAFRKGSKEIKEMQERLGGVVKTLNLAQTQTAITRLESIIAARREQVGQFRPQAQAVAAFGTTVTTGGEASLLRSVQASLRAEQAELDILRAREKELLDIEISRSRLQQLGVSFAKEENKAVRARITLLEKISKLMRGFEGLEGRGFRAGFAPLGVRATTEASPLDVGPPTLRGLGAQPGGGTLLSETASQLRTIGAVLRTELHPASELWVNTLSDGITDILFRARSLKDVLRDTARSIVGTVVGIGVRTGLGALFGGPGGAAAGAASALGSSGGSIFGRSVTFVIRGDELRGVLNAQNDVSSA